MFERKLISTIPGIIPKRLSKEKQGYIENLNTKSKAELQELLERQQKLLANKSFIMKLPDKGAKITDFHKKIMKEIDFQSSVDQVGVLLSNLDINNEQRTLDDLEWGTKDTVEQYLDSDVDEVNDPLKIIVQCTDHTKQLRTIKPPKPLITASDIEDIQSFDHANNEAEDHHITYVISKEENSKKVLKNQYKPYKTTISDVHDPSKEGLRKRGSHWENTAATHPPSVHGPAQLISLHESIALQKQQDEHLKQVELKHAADKLSAQLGYAMKCGFSISNVKGLYRDPNEAAGQESDDEAYIDSDDEIHDEDDPIHGGTVTYTYTTDQ